MRPFALRPDRQVRTLTAINSARSDGAADVLPLLLPIGVLSLWPRRKAIQPQDRYMGIYGICILSFIVSGVSISMSLMPVRKGFASSKSCKAGTMVSSLLPISVALREPVIDGEHEVLSGHQATLI